MMSPCLRALSARQVSFVPAPVQSRMLCGAPKSSTSRWDQMVSTFKEHGAVFAGYYVTAYAVCFGGAWGAITFAGVDGVGLLRRMGCERVIDVTAWSPRWVNAGIALIIADFLEPLRLPLVLATTPRLSRLLRRR
uniref:DUF1279 domain-containing protein n=1 Tax=Calcidiscus leptoporus TaxID=127549 RepID=A0A7S0P3L6_9EUKA|mmetsp:Transcript_57503/g.132053  ORF Transcript_57503/g.132053 Transcript_57503/m.132053 type:complete len:135 (+) Transcript_57503:71-475(+)